MLKIQIQKATSSAYVTILNSDETDLYRVDTSSPDVTVDGSSMLFSLPVAAAIFYGADYRIQVDEGAVKSAQECDLAQPAGEDWGFKWTGKFFGMLYFIFNRDVQKKDL